MEQTNKKSGTLYLIISILCFIGAIITLIPYKGVDDECLFGYKAICAFTPISSLVLIAVGILLMFLRKKVTKNS
jgi:hypothetical protein